MRKSSVLLGACAFTMAGIYSASATLPAPAYVDVLHGSDGNAGSGCLQAAPCADLNTALSVLGAGGANVVVIVGGGVFGPVVINQDLDIIGTDPNQYANIIADPSADVGCIGALPGPAGCNLTNNGYAMEFNGGANDQLTMTNVSIRAGGGTNNALKIGSGEGVTITNCVFNGSGSGGPTIQIYPNNGAPSFMALYLSHSFITGGSGANSGAVEVKPVGDTSVGLHFNHVEVAGASFGIRTDGSLLNSGAQVSTFVSNSEFFALTVAAVNAFSTAGTGKVLATFESTHILSAGVGLKANGINSFVVLNNNTVTGNGIGIQQVNNATVYTGGNNQIQNNTNNVSGTLTPSALK